MNSSLRLPFDCHAVIRWPLAGKTLGLPRICFEEYRVEVSSVEYSNTLNAHWIFWAHTDVENRVIKIPMIKRFGIGFSGFICGFVFDKVKPNEVGLHYILPYFIYRSIWVKRQHDPKIVKPRKNPNLRIHRQSSIWFGSAGWLWEGWEGLKGCFGEVFFWGEMNDRGVELLLFTTGTETHAVGLVYKLLSILNS